MASVLTTSLMAGLLLSTATYGYPLDKYLVDLLGAMNRSADPCEDFHEYACGKWVKEYCSTDHIEHLTSKKDVDLHYTYTTFLESLKSQTDLTELEKLLSDNYENCMKSTFDENKRFVVNDYNSAIDRVKFSNVDGESDLLHIVRFSAAVMREFGYSPDYLPFDIQVGQPNLKGSMNLKVNYFNLVCDNCKQKSTKYSYKKADASTSRQAVTAFLEELLQISKQEASKLLGDYDVEVFEAYQNYYDRFDRTEAKRTILKKAIKYTRQISSDDRSEKCRSFIERASIGAFLRSYVKRVLKRDLSELKAELDMFVNEIAGAFPALISTNRWIPLHEKASLIKYVDDIRYHLGLPDWCLSDEAVLAKSQRFLPNMTFLENQHRACEQSKQNPFEIQACLVGIGGAYSLRFNAEYNRVLNSVSFYQGTLLDPSFVVGSQLKAIRFGRLGQTTGHELMHGVDIFVEKSAKEHGGFYNYSNQNVRQCVVELYKDGLPLRGLSDFSSKTVSEDLPDIDGLRLSYLAYKIHKLIVPQPPKPEKVADFSNDQLFFISYANRLCSCETKKDISEKHTLNRLRAEIPAWQMPQFGRAFQCKPDSKYCTGKKCTTYTRLN